MRKALRIPWRRSLSGRSRRQLNDFVTGLASRALGILDLRGRKTFLEQEISGAFGFRRVEIVARPEGAERFSSESTRVRDLLTRVLGILEGTRKPFLNHTIAQELGVAAILGPLGGTYAIPIRREQQRLGLLVLDSSPQMQLAPYIEEILMGLCNQLAVVLESSDLLRRKLELERTLAQQAQIVQLGEMTARIAHEIKNPLSSIKTIIQVMQEDPALQPKYSQDLHLIKGEVDRLADSVVQLLEFARPMPGRPGEVRLREAAESALAFLARDIERLGTVVVNEVSEELPLVVGDSSMFREIFLNLILNALQAGGFGMHLWLSAQQRSLEDERFVLLVVEDDGPGVPTELQSKIFFPFFTTKQKGTGLGLAIVQRNVEHLGGQITVESPTRDGKGTRFLLHLPVSDE